MRAKKENKVYDINEAQKQAYLDQGFDIYDNDGNIMEYSALKKISYNEHIKKVSALKAEIEQLKQNHNSADNVMDLLKGYAEEKGIDVGASTSPSGILEKILKAEKEM
jgi:hypothetical protein